jgi:hypothetical protein
MSFTSTVLNKPRLTYHSFPCRKLNDLATFRIVSREAGAVSRTALLVLREFEITYVPRRKCDALSRITRHRGTNDRIEVDLDLGTK